MELKQLQYFFAVAKAGSISKASEKLFITQPALSRCIKRLEDDIGISLFNRQGPKLHLTEAGEIFLAGLDSAKVIFEQSLDSARLASNGGSNALSLVCCYEEFDNSILYDFNKRFPNIVINYFLLPPDQAYRELLAGKADFAILPHHPTHTGVVGLELMSEEMLLSASSAHPLYGQQFVAVEQLDGQSIICNDVAYAYDYVYQVCEAQGISMKQLFSSNDHQKVGKFKSIYESLLFIPISAVLHFSTESDKTQNTRPDLVFPARIVPQVFRRKVVVAYQKEKTFSRAEHHLLQLLKDHYNRLAESIQAFTIKKYGG